MLCFNVSSRFEIQQKLKAAKKKEREKKKKAASAASVEPAKTPSQPQSQNRRSKVEEAKKGTNKFSALADLKAKREEKRRQGKT